MKFKLISKALLNCLLALIFFGLPLFLPAHSLRFWNAWLFLAIFILSMFAILLYLFIKDPVLMEKRMRGDEKENPQRFIMTFLIVSALLTFVVSGFDFRYHWSSVPFLLVVISAIIMLCGFILLFIVTIENSYASRVIEIQEEQKLIDTGLYAVIRHPMYFAFSIIFLVTPILLGSYFAFIPACLIPWLISLRILNEEQLLLKGLKGYDIYMKKVKYRMIPFIW